MVKRYFRDHFLLILIGVYLVSRLAFLTRLPIFADEAIYIRWAQVAVHEPEKYAFLPMLDGKTPLHAWSLIPFLVVFSDPLFAGRLASVFFGLITLVLLKKIVQLFGGGWKEQSAAMIVMIVTPFWFLYQRMALAESLLTCLYTVGLFFAIRFFQTTRPRDLLFFGISGGAMLWTKINALFLFPSFVLLPFLFSLSPNVKKEQRPQIPVYAFGFVLSLGLFLLLKFSPLFPSLFSRSADYSFSIAELLGGEWKTVVFRIFPKVLWWFAIYMTPFAYLFLLVEWKKIWKFVLLAALYAAPIIGVGRVLYSRYFYPALVPLTIGVALAVTAKRSDRLNRFVRSILVLFFITSIGYQVVAVVRPDATFYAQEDVVQYLTEWSSGHGIKEVSEYIKNELRTNPQEKSIYVATEGFFGSLPDGLLLYFDKPVYEGKVEIHGIGQPIMQIPQSLVDRSKTQTVYLIVNEHRFFDTNTDHYTVVKAYERPFGAPRLFFLQVK